MGSKNLKAIACGSKRTVVEPANPEALRDAVLDAHRKIRENGVTGQGLPTYGTAVLVNIINIILNPTHSIASFYKPHQLHCQQQIQLS